MNTSMRLPREKKGKETSSRAIGKVLIAGVILLVLVGTFAIVMQYTGAPNQFPKNPDSLLAPQSPK